MLPITLADQQPYPLTRLGGPEAGFVLTTANRRTPELRYRVPEHRSGDPRRWLKVVLRARVELAGDHGGRGFGAISLLTSNYSSATAEFGPVRDSNGAKKVRWTGAALHGGREVVTARQRFRIAFTNYARVQGSKPGVHTLAFRLRIDDGLRVRRVTIEPGSGLWLTRQPPQALAVASTKVIPSRPGVGQPFKIRFSIKNNGVIDSGPVSFDPLLPPAFKLRARLPQIKRIAPGRTDAADLDVVAESAGSYRIETLASSRVGQALAIARPTVVATSPTPERTARTFATLEGRNDEGGTGPIRVVLIGVAVVGVLGIGVWRRARQAR